MTSINPATPELLERFYGRLPERTSQAIVAMEGERVVGVAGLYRDGARLVVFTELDGVRADKRLIVKGYRALLPIMRAAGLPVLALCDVTVKGSELLLLHYKFKPIGVGVWQWQE